MIEVPDWVINPFLDVDREGVVEEELLCNLK